MRSCRIALFVGVSSLSHPCTAACSACQVRLETLKQQKAEIESGRALEGDGNSMPGLLKLQASPSRKKRCRRLASLLRRLLMQPTRPGQVKEKQN